MQAEDNLNIFFVYFDINGKQNKFRENFCRFIRSGFVKNVINSLIL